MDRKKPSKGNPPNDLTAGYRIDAVCNEFESAWLAGSGPKIEQFLSDNPDAESKKLLRSLIDLEFELLRNDGVDPDPEEYRVRFPHAATAVSDALQSLKKRGITKPDSTLIKSKLDTDTGLRETVRLKCPNCATEVVATRKPGTDAKVACSSCGRKLRIRSSGTQGKDQSKKLPENIGRYQVKGRLGEGAFGTVYRAWDPKLEREVALKIPHKELFQDREFRDRFIREARSLAALRHECICPIHEIHKLADGRLYLSLALIKGRPLSDLVDKDHPMLPARAGQIIAQAATALQVAHNAGIVHRDLKPANIMVTKDDLPVITDFGLARRDADASMTQTGIIMGTPAYMSPEQAQGKASDLTVATDIYSLGATLYELLTGVRPFSGQTSEVIAQVLRDDPLPPSEVNTGLSADWDEICQRSMAKRSEDRYATMKDLADAVVAATAAVAVTLKETYVDDRKSESRNASIRAMSSTEKTGRNTNLFRSRTGFVVAITAICLTAGGTFLFLDRDKPETLITESDSEESAAADAIEFPRSGPEKDSPLIGRWRVYSERLPVSGGVLEFFASGKANIQIRSGDTIEREEFEFRTKPIPESSYASPFQNYQFFSFTISGTQRSGSSAVPDSPVGGFRLGGVKPTLQDFAISDGEDWYVTSFQPGTFHIRREAKEFLDTGRHETVVVQLGELAVCPFEGAVGTPLVEGHHTLVGTWSTSEGRSVGTGTRHLQFTPDGWLYTYGPEQKTSRPLSMERFSVYPGTEAGHLIVRVWAPFSSPPKLARTLQIRQLDYKKAVLQETVRTQQMRPQVYTELVTVDGRTVPRTYTRHVMLDVDRTYEFELIRVSPGVLNALQFNSAPASPNAQVNNARVNESSDSGQSSNKLQGLLPGRTDIEHAEWVLKMDGEVTIQFRRGTEIVKRTINSPAELPEGRIELVEVDLEGNSAIIDANATLLADAYNLRTLNLGKTVVSDKGVAWWIGNLKKLESLTLWHTQVSDRAIDEIGKLENLTTLELDGLSFRDDSLAGIGYLQKLRRLKLSRTSITDAAVVHLERLKTLEALWVNETNVSSAGVERLRASLPDCDITWD